MTKLIYALRRQRRRFGCHLSQREDRALHLVQGFTPLPRSAHRQVDCAASTALGTVCHPATALTPTTLSATTRGASRSMEGLYTST